MQTTGFQTSQGRGRQPHFIHFFPKGLFFVVKYMKQTQHQTENNNNKYPLLLSHQQALHFTEMCEVSTVGTAILQRRDLRHGEVKKRQSRRGRARIWTQAVCLGSMLESTRLRCLSQSTYEQMHPTHTQFPITCMIVCLPLAKGTVPGRSWKLTVAFSQAHTVPLPVTPSTKVTIILHLGLILLLFVIVLVSTDLNEIVFVFYFMSIESCVFFYDLLIKLTSMFSRFFPANEHSFGSPRFWAVTHSVFSLSILRLDARSFQPSW